jgi:hypothetical protein
MISRLASNGELKIVGFRLGVFLKNHKSIQTEYGLSTEFVC